MARNEKWHEIFINIAKKTQNKTSIHNKKGEMKKKLIHTKGSVPIIILLIIIYI